MLHTADLTSGTCRHLHEVCYGKKQLKGSPCMPPLWDIMHYDDLPRIETLLRNSSYIFLFLNVLPCRTEKDRSHVFLLRLKRFSLIVQMISVTALRNIWIIIYLLHETQPQIFPLLQSARKASHCVHTGFHLPLCYLFTVHASLQMYQLASTAQKLTGAHLQALGVPQTAYFYTKYLIHRVYECTRCLHAEK